MTLISPQGPRPASASSLPYEALCDVDTASIRYRVQGPEDAPPLVLSNSLGTSMWMWDAQMPSFSRNFRVLRYDSRGHGGSSAPVGPYTIERLARDVIGLLDALNIRRVHFCGLSMGGLVGMWLGVHASERIDRLVLCNTAPHIGSAGYMERADRRSSRWRAPDHRRGRNGTLVHPGLSAASTRSRGAHASDVVCQRLRGLRVVVRGGA